MNYLDAGGHSDGLGYFFQSMTVNLTQEQASAYSKKLSESATRFATTLKAQALGVHPEFGTTAEEHENYLIQLGKNKPLYRSIENLYHLILIKKLRNLKLEKVEF